MSYAEKNFFPSIRNFIFLVLISLFIFVHHSFAQSGEPLVIKRIDKVVFDGIPDEDGWETIEPVPMIQYEPNAGAQPTQKTEIRFAYDNTYFYGSMRAYDTDLKGIRNNSLYRDRLAGSDHFELLLDTYNDNENAYVFSTTPAGIRNDLAITNDGTGGTVLQGNWINPDFNTFWDAKAIINDKGWFCEIRIPFSSLRFQDNHGRVIMGLIVQRKIARIPERLVYPAVKPVTDWAFLRPSLAQKIVIEGIKPSRKFYVVPYALVGVNSSNQMNESGTAYSRIHEYQKEIGGDVKYSITNNLTMDFTVNTDFAQAEADDQMINLTRFSLFYPEKRQFFQERAGIFDFRTGGLSRLFYSRKIGLTDDGDQVKIYGGTRLVGRVGTWDIGLLDMQTQKLDTIPSENFGVLRLRRRVFNNYSYAGGMFTSRIGTNGRYNYAYGLDGVVRLYGDDYLTLQWTQTFDDVPRVERPVEGINNSRFAIELTRRRKKGFGYDISSIYSGVNNNPGIGFIDRSDFTFGSSAVSYTWFYAEGSPLIWQKLQMMGFSYWGNLDHKMQSAETGPEWTFRLKDTSEGLIETKMIYENLSRNFYLSDKVYVPPGEYNFFRIACNYDMTYEKILRTGIGMTTGKFYDGWNYGLSLTPSWYASKHFEISTEYVYNHIDFSTRNQILDSHILRLRIGTALNSKISTNALVQYNSGISLVSANIRFRYNFREGNDLWIVFNEGLNTTRFDYNPEKPLSDTESFLIKYTHTFLF
jgi:hypothetical protein